MVSVAPITFGAVTRADIDAVISGKGTLHNSSTLTRFSPTAVVTEGTTWWSQSPYVTLKGTKTVYDLGMEGWYPATWPEKGGTQTIVLKEKSSAGEPMDSRWSVIA